MAFPFLLAATGLKAFAGFASSKSNQKAAEREAQFSLERAKLEEDRFRRDAKRLQGRMAAVANKAGRPLTSGSIADLRAEQVGEDELDALIIRYGGQIGAYRNNMRANQFRRQSILGPISTILGGANQAGFFNPSSTAPTVGNINPVSTTPGPGYGSRHF